MKIIFRYKIIMLVLTVMFFFQIANLQAQASGQFDKRPNADQWVFDYADIISEHSEKRINSFLEVFHEGTDVEFLAVSVDNLNTLRGPKLEGEDINALVNQLFHNWKVGIKTKGHKGLLFVVLKDEKQVRLEVGNDLEGIYTDAFVGYIEREQMQPFFEQGRIGDGFEATLELIVDRAYKSMENGSYDPDQTAGMGGTEYRSGGGGARREMDIGSVDAQPKPDLGEDIRSYFSAQATPQATLERYFEMSRRHIKDPDLGIFTDATKAFFRNWTVTNAQQDNERQYEGVVGTTKINGDYAVIYYPTKDWTFNPFFLKRGDEGWQLDFATMTKVIRFNHRNYWRFVSRDHPYMFAFSEYKVDENGFVWYKRKKGQRGYINLSFPWSKVPMQIKWIARSGSAYKQGVRIGDVITHINGKDVKKIGFAAAVNEAAGPIGTSLDLRVYRRSEKRSIDFTIMREEEKF